MARIPAFYFNKWLTKKISDKKKLFEKKHLLSLYGAICLIALTIVILLANKNQYSGEFSEKPYMLVYIIVIPWAIIRTTIEIVRITQLKKNHDPYFSLVLLTNLISVALTVAAALTDLRLVAEWGEFAKVILLILVYVFVI